MAAGYISVQEAFKKAAEYSKEYTDKKISPITEAVAKNTASVENLKTTKADESELSAIKEEIAQVAESIGEIATIEHSINIFDKTDVSSGYSPSTTFASDNSLIANSNYFTVTTPYDAVKDDFFVSNKPFHCFEYRLDGDVYNLRGHGNATNNNEIYMYTLSQSSAVKAMIRFSSVVYGSINEIMIVKNGELPKEYQAYGETNVIINPNAKIPQIDGIKDTLYGKTILNFGDSIAKGAGNDGVGYAKIIAEKHGMTVFDDSGTAVSGSTLTYVANRVNIVGRVDGRYNDVLPDFVLLEGGINDYYEHKTDYDTTLGTLSNSYNPPNDTTTLYNALDYMLYRSKTKWVGAKIIYVINHKVGDAHQAKWDGSVWSQNTVRKAIIDACEKWSVPYVDLFTLSGLNTALDLYKPFTNSSDKLHPTAEGYNKFYIPLIENVMKSVAE